MGGRERKRNTHLIIISLSHGLVRRHEGVIITNLEQQTLHRDVVPLGVAGVIPVVNQSTHEGTAFPP